ncbi:MAG TPA: hypothetical protein VFW85_11025 [Gaiellaceae bacterium]|nr:hypothetical protein [Gaiellaceae bacterium]
MDTELLHDYPWDELDFNLLPPAIRKVRGMLTGREKAMLYWIALRAYEAEGLILDQGCFLGGSTVCFAAGLRSRGLAKPLIHSYDRFVLGDFEREHYFADGAPPDDRFRPLYDENLAGYRDLVTVHEGDMLAQTWPGDPIEILFVDIAKTSAVWDHVVASFFTSLIPRRSLLILQDYLFEHSGPWHHVVMEKLANHFELVGDTEKNSMLFAYVGGLTAGEIQEARWDHIAMHDRVELMDRAIAKLDTQEKRELLANVRAALVEEDLGSTRPDPR